MRTLLIFATILLASCEDCKQARQEKPYWVRMNDGTIKRYHQVNTMDGGLRVYEGCIQDGSTFISTSAYIDTNGN